MTPPSRRSSGLVVRALRWPQQGPIWSPNCTTMAKKIFSCILRLPGKCKETLFFILYALPGQDDNRNGGTKARKPSREEVGVIWKQTWTIYFRRKWRCEKMDMFVVVTTAATMIETAYCLWRLKGLTRLTTTCSGSPWVTNPTGWD